MTLEYGHVDYESFGAVGDGVSDDLPAICEAHPFANARGLSVTVRGLETASGKALRVSPNAGLAAVTQVVEQR